MVLIRPSPFPPPSEGVTPYPLPKLIPKPVGGDDLPYVCIKHPGYDGHSDLIQIPAFDPLPSTGDDLAEDEGEVTTGVHHETVLTICAIIADNAFNVYLTDDRDGTQRVDARVHRDSILEAGKYWAQVPRDSSGPADAGQQQPPSSASTPQGTAADTAEAGQEGGEPTADIQGPWIYPIVRSFDDWEFPTQSLPGPWFKDHEPPVLPAREPNSASTAVAKVLDDRIGRIPSCVISRHSVGTEKAHIVPLSCRTWFMENNLDHLGGPDGTGINKPTNLITLRADIHKIFDEKFLAIVPKPVSVGPSPPTSDSDPTTAPASQATQYALAVHVLNCRWKDQEIISLFHNQALSSPENSNNAEKNFKFSRPFLFARLAWSIFPLLQSFLEKEERKVIIRQKTSDSNMLASSMELKPKSQIRQETWRRQPPSGSRTGSNERSASQTSRDTSHAECDNIADDKSDGSLLREWWGSPTAGPQADGGLPHVYRWIMSAEPADTGGPSTQLPGQTAAVGAENVPRGRTLRRGEYRRTHSGSNSPRGSGHEPSASPGCGS